MKPMLAIHTYAASASLVPAIVQKRLAVTDETAANHAFSVQEELPLGTRAYRRTIHGMRSELMESRKRIEDLEAENLLLKQYLTLAKLRENEVRNYAYHDELTGLPNRRLLKDRLTQAMAQAARNKNFVALLVIDLDGFKEINDTLGHSAGDQLLCQVADRLQKAIRTTDTACRYGGDEFLVMLPELDDEKAIETVTDKIVAFFDMPYVLGGQKIFIKASIGCAVYPGDVQTSEELIDQADTAMYRMKAQRRQVLPV